MPREASSLATLASAGCEREDIALTHEVKSAWWFAKLITNPKDRGPVRKRLSREEVTSRVKGLDGWRLEGDFIAKDFEFETFMDGIRFIGQVAGVAEELDHHPDIQVRYTSVKLSLQTHSEGGVTEMDIELAKRVDSLTSWRRSPESR